MISGVGIRQVIFVSRLIYSRHSQHIAIEVVRYILLFQVIRNGRVQIMTGVYYTPSSTSKDIMEKDNPEIFDYNIPQRLRDIYAAKDYGRWADATGELPVCFIATNHTTGGNSGSPVINADGNLIGINFDPVWEGTMNDIIKKTDRLILSVNLDALLCKNLRMPYLYSLLSQSLDYFCSFLC